MCTPLFTLMKKEKLANKENKISKNLNNKEIDDISQNNLNYCCNQFPQTTFNNGEICEKIKNFTDEIKEKFIKKKNRSSNFNFRKKNEIKKQRESYFDNEKYLKNDFNKNITRIKINTTNDFTLNNNSTPESRSPFVNRALPPLPKNENNSSQSINDFFTSSKSSTSNFTNKNRVKSSNIEVERNKNFYHLNNLENLKKKKLLHSIQNNFSHPPPHLHSRKDINVYLDDDDEEEEDEDEDEEEEEEEVEVVDDDVNLNKINFINNDKNTKNDEEKELNEKNDSFFQNSNIRNNRNLINLNSNLIHETNNSLINNEGSNYEEEIKKMMDYAKSIEKVKDCGWYWGPISGEKAEKLLENEPEGSFIVRDSSDENYIFSLTFKLKGDIIHVRIEHDQGNFSFGSLQKFSSSTIVDFIKEVVENSRSGEYLFFLHRLPVVGPTRVELLHPVSRFRRIQSLKHICRFIILKYVRRDLVNSLPLPEKLIKYLNMNNYYHENTSFVDN